jgi:hypothetical protein
VPRAPSARPPRRTIGLLPVLLIAAGLGGCASDGGGTLVRARFDCDDGGRLNLVFDHSRDAVILTLGKDRTQVLPSKSPQAGMWYAGDGYELRGAGDELSYTAPAGGAPVRCVQYR